MGYRVWRFGKEARGLGFRVLPFVVNSTVMTYQHSCHYFRLNAVQGLLLVFATRHGAYVCHNGQFGNRNFPKALSLKPPTAS